MGLRNIQGVASAGPRERLAGERKENSKDDPRFWLEQSGRLVGPFTEMGWGGQDNKVNFKLIECEMLWNSQQEGLAGS